MTNLAPNGLLQLRADALRAAAGVLAGFSRKQQADMLYAEADTLAARVTRPKSTAERWAWLVADAKRIMENTSKHSAEEVRWAQDTISVHGADRRR